MVYRLGNLSSVYLRICASKQNLDVDVMNFLEALKAIK